MRPTHLCGSVMPRIQLSIFVTQTLAFSGDAIYYFLRGWVFVFCFAFCSCHASHLIASCALHLHVFIKLAPVCSCHVPLAFVDCSETNCVFVSLLSNHLTSLQPPTPSFVRPKTSPNPTRAFINDGFKSSPNVYKTSPFYQLDSLSHSFSAI